MGRATKPLSLVKANHLTNDEKEKRKKQEEKVNSKLKSDKLKPPSWLCKDGKKLFKYYVEEFKDLEILKNVDINGLATYCDLHITRLKLKKDVEENGVRFTQTNSKGGETHVTNPSQTQLNQTIKLMQSYESKYGLTPVDRMKLSFDDEENKEPSEVEKKYDV